MRREVLIKAITSIRQDLISSGITSMLDMAINFEGKSLDSSWFSLEAFKNYSILIDKYGKAENEIADILGISPLFKSAYWEQAMSFPDGENLYNLHARLAILINELPIIALLFQQDGAESLIKDPSISHYEIGNKEAITFILPEDELTHSSPARLIAALQATSSLYQVLAELENLSSNDLILLSLDSGSDKSFDLLGAAKVMEQLRLLILDIWDRRVFHRQKSISQSLDLIANSLPILEKIDALKKSQAIGPEEAELMKRKTLASVTQFLESGVIISEIDAESAHSPRLLMQPEVKLLAAPLHLETEISSDPDTGSKNSELTDEQIDQLEDLLEKARQNRSGKVSKSSRTSPNKKSKSG